MAKFETGEDLLTNIQFQGLNFHHGWRKFFKFLY